MQWIRENYRVPEQESNHGTSIFHFFSLESTERAILPRNVHKNSTRKNLGIVLQQI